jgi:hypothetical protein
LAGKTTLPPEPPDRSLAARMAHMLDSEPPEVTNPAGLSAPRSPPIQETISASISRAPSPVIHVSPWMKRL